MRRLTLLAVTGVMAVGAAAPALAESLTAPTTSLPKPTVTYSTNGGVFVGTALGSQPLASAAVANGSACVGFSLEVPFCASVPVTTAIPRDINVGPVHASVSTAGGGVSVGTALGSQPLASAWYYNGTACVGFSLEVPFCATIPLNTIGRPRTDTPIPNPVRIWYSTNGGIFVGTAFNAQPLVGASVANGWACVGFSYEIPYCYPLNSQNKTARPTQALPGGGVVFYHDDNRTVVGFQDVGVVIYSNGTICPVVSTQAWRCINGG